MQNVASCVFLEPLSFALFCLVLWMYLHITWAWFCVCSVVCSCGQWGFQMSVWVFGGKLSVVLGISTQSQRPCTTGATDLPEFPSAIINVFNFCDSCKTTQHIFELQSLNSHVSLGRVYSGIRVMHCPWSPPVIINRIGPIPLSEHEI